MHESMSSIESGAAWNPEARPSHIEDALVRLDEVIAKASKLTGDLIGRLDIVLQPEEPSEMKDGGVSQMLPTSIVVRRLDEATRSIESLIRRMSGAMDRLDT